MKSKREIKNHARFKGNFKKDVKGEIDGRDLAEFIAEQLRQKNYAVHSVENDEISFTVKVSSGSIEYPLMVCLSIENDDYWEISCPRTLGFLDRLLGKSENTALQNLVNSLDDILQNEKTITDIKWYSDYLDRSDDYIQKRTQKYLSIIGKYLYKLFLPMWMAGFILVLIGGIRSGKESMLVRIGITICFLLIFGYFGLIAVNLWLGLIYNIKDTSRNKLKKKWISWIFFLLLTAGFTVLAWMSGRLVLKVLFK